MLANFAHIINVSLSCFCLFILHNIYIHINNKNFMFIDYFCRINFTESPITYFYFIWTNSYYLYFFISLFLYFLFLKRSIKFGYYYFFLTPLLIVLMFFDVYFFNIPTKQINFDSINFNALLSNRINKVHPLLFFYVFIKIIYFNFNSVKTTSTIKLTNIILFTIFLGSWWAFQEGSWGGWWDWDASELFSLFVLYNVLFNFHYSKNMKKTTLILQPIFLVISLYLILFYTTLQISLSVVSHNFGIIQEGSFWYINYLIFFSLNFVLLVFNFLKITEKAKVYYFLVYKMKINLCNNTLNIFYKLLISLILFSIIYLSFSILLTNYIQNISILITQLLPYNSFNFFSFLLSVYIFYIFFCNPRISVSFNILLALLTFLITSNLILNVYLYLIFFTFSTTFLNFKNFLTHTKKIYHILFYCFVLISTYYVYNIPSNQNFFKIYNFIDILFFAIKKNNTFTLDNFNVFKINVTCINVDFFYCNSKFNNLVTFNNTNIYLNYLNYNSFFQIRLPFIDNFKTLSKIEELNLIYLFIYLFLFLSLVWVKNSYLYWFYLKI